jgi:16S rRNA U1498 N3-methylase RsmE
VRRPAPPRPERAIKLSGIAADEHEELTEAGAQPVRISDGLLRTSTAGVVALAGLKLRRERAGAP